MIITKLNGGLGNQMFQYAAGKSLSLHHEVPLYLDISSFYREKLPDLELPRLYELNCFPAITDHILTQNEAQEAASANSAKNILQKMLPRHKRKVYTEKYFHYDRHFFLTNKKVFLKGNWQSEKYFSTYSQEIRNLFVFKKELIENVQEFSSSIQNRQTVGVHIRRGDYLRKKIILEWHGVMSLDYYRTAFSILDKEIGDYKVIYFSDDTEWIRSELFPIKKGTIVSESVSKTHFEDLYLMSQCKHNIIANSSFSWWGAWLNNNPDKIVIGPKKWFDQGPKDTFDILPPEWITI